jgi:2',3'-cyclic-nucleotide 2'-phosphodiesterase/3'-nucleotidase
MNQPVGSSTVPINTYLSLLGNDAALTLVNQAQLWYAAPLVAAGRYAHLPLLSAASPFKAGGAGPDSFVDIKPGPLDMRDIASLYMFANTVCVVKVSGAELREWLERSCALFARIDPAVRAARRELPVRHDRRPDLRDRSVAAGALRRGWQTDRHAGASRRAPAA